MLTKLRIATRKSPLALWQAEFVKTALQQTHPELQVELVPLTTQGDRILDQHLMLHGGKGLFVKELERAMLENKADIAVHSMKDLPASFPDGLQLAVICPREDPRDAFVAHQYSSVSQLPQAAIIGTASLRRQSQMLALRSDLQVKMLRGNVNTRLQKLHNGDYDAIILAAAGLKRIACTDHIRHYFSVDEMLPAVGQGAIGIETRADDGAVLELLRPLHDEETSYCVMAERMVSERLGAGCHMPLAAYATITGGVLQLSARLAEPTGQKILQAHAKGDMNTYQQIGEQVAEQLFTQGAQALLQNLAEYTKS